MIKLQVTRGFIKKGTKILFNQKDFLDKTKQDLAIRQIRGNVITVSVDIEKQLDYLLADVLFGGAENRFIKNQHDKTKGEVKFFREFIINSTNFPFASKIKVFRALYKLHPYLRRKKICKELATNLKKVMEWRNNFAHGEVAFKLFSKTNISKNPYLLYYGDNNQREVKLNNHLFDKIINPLFKTTSVDIRNLRESINRNFKRAKKPALSINY